MSFIYNYFSSDATTPSEKENAAALKAIVNDHKAVLKTEFKQYESEYRHTFKDAEAEYERVRKQAEETMHRNMMDAVKREMDIILATDEYASSDAKTKAKIAQFQTWVGCGVASYVYELKGGEEGKVMVEKQQQPPSYQRENTALGSNSYPDEKDNFSSV